MNERKPSPRKRRRWWLALPALALLLTGGVIAYRIHLGPQLQPAASSIFANNLPAIFRSFPRRGWATWRSP